MEMFLVVTTFDSHRFNLSVLRFLIYFQKCVSLQWGFSFSFYYSIAVAFT